MLTSDQSKLIREAFDNLRFTTSGLDELRNFRFSVYHRSESPRTGAARALHVNGLVEFMGHDGTNHARVLYMPTEQGVDAAVRLGVISSADVSALEMDRKRANLRAQGGV